MRSRPGSSDRAFTQDDSREPSCERELGGLIVEP